MPTRETSTARDRHALDWAAKHLPFDREQRTRHTPWASVYKLNGHSRCASLWILSPQLVHTLKTASALAQQFLDLVPAVIADNESLGALLLHDRGGAPLDFDDDVQCLALLTKYADLQAKARHLPQLLSCFHAIDLNALLPALLQFLDPAPAQPDSESSVGATYFLSKSKCKSYFLALSVRRHLIAALLDKAKRLPVTINHGDLRPEKVTIESDQTLVITDWERAIVGPAGLSLQALFDGCATSAALLAQSEDHRQTEATSHHRHLLDAYIDALAKENYAAKPEIEDGLPGAICAGVIQSVLWYANYPDNDSTYRKMVRRHLESQLSDLLDLCDELALADRETALACAHDYGENGRQWRSEKILHRYAAMHKHDSTAHVELARVRYQRGKHEAAIESYQLSIALAPHEATVYDELGRVFLENLRLDEAAASFEQARQHGAPAARIDAQVERLADLRRCEDDAYRDHIVPTISLSDSEIKAQKWRPEYLALGAKLFRQYGVLLIHNAFDKALIHACNDYFIQRYTEYFKENTHDKALNIGDKRYQIGITLEGVFNDPQLYANPFLLALMRQLFGDEFVVGCTVCATSLPGSKDQHLHKDHLALFARDSNDQPMSLPPFAITTMIPFVSLDEKIGTTSVKKGSHRLSKRESAQLPDQFPMAPVGSCFLMDMSLSHRGLGNQTDTIRPILNMVYQQPWFFDSKNYTKHPPLQIPRSEYKHIPEAHLRLFEWGTQLPQINQ